jgi:hypothetical protein
VGSPIIFLRAAFVFLQDWGSCVLQQASRGELEPAAAAANGGGGIAAGALAPSTPRRLRVLDARQQQQQLIELQQLGVLGVARRACMGRYVVNCALQSDCLLGCCSLLLCSMFGEHQQVLAACLALGIISSLAPHILLPVTIHPSQV